MNRRAFISAAAVGVTACALPGLQAGAAARSGAPTAGVRGLCLNAPKRGGLGPVVRMIDEILPGLGCNTLVLLVRYQYEFKSHPGVREPESLTQAEVRELVRACRRNGIRLIPKMNHLGHQSSKKRGTERGLLRAFPEFDETPDLEEVRYARCLCPRHPKVAGVIGDLTVELAEAFEADAFHVGLDEVFELGRCPRCKGTKNADLFGDWILTLHAHIKGKLGLEMWMWADRLLEHAAMPYTEHEASVNDTWQCLDRLPKDLVLCDWHYDRSKGFPSTAFFLGKGFRVLSCPWVDEVSGRAFLESAREAAGRERTGGAKWDGFLQTSWCDSAQLATILLEKKENEKVSGVFEKDIPYYVARMMRKGMPAGYAGDFARAGRLAE